MKMKDSPRDALGREPPDPGMTVGYLRAVARNRDDLHRINIAYGGNSELTNGCMIDGEAVLGSRAHPLMEEAGQFAANSAHKGTYAHDNKWYEKPHYIADRRAARTVPEMLIQLNFDPPLESFLERPVPGSELRAVPVAELVKFVEANFADILHGFKTALEITDSQTNDLAIAVRWTVTLPQSFPMGHSIGISSLQRAFWNDFVMSLQGRIGECEGEVRNYSPLRKTYPPKGVEPPPNTGFFTYPTSGWSSFLKWPKWWS